MAANMRKLNVDLMEKLIKIWGFGRWWMMYRNGKKYHFVPTGDPREDYSPQGKWLGDPDQDLEME